jgi:gliding motility-associated-like protein
VPNPTVTTTVDRTYQVRISDLLNNCSETFTIQVKAADFPPVAPVPVMLVCPGIATALNPKGDPLYKYTWTPSTGLSATDVPNPTVTTTVDRTYQVRISDFLNNCGQTFVIQVKAADFPSVAPPPSIVACEGAATLLNPSGDSLYKYAWTPATGLSATDIPNPTVTTTVGRTYQVRISEPLNNCSQTFTVRVIVPDFLSVGPDTIITVCKNVPTAINPRGSSSFSYSWSPAAGLNAANIPNPVLTAATPQIYAVTIRDSTGRCQLSYPVRINVSPPMNVDAGKDTTLCSTGAFTVEGSAVNAVRFQWSAQRNFGTIIGENARQAVNLNRGNNVFYIRTTDALGCVEIDSVAIRAFPLLASVPGSIIACLPDDRKDITVTNGDPGQTLSYRWSPSNLIVSDPNAGPTAIIRAQTGATISVVVTNQSGCSATFNTRLEVLNLPSVLTIDAAKNPIKKGETTTLTVRGCQDCSVSWSPSTGLGSATGAAVSASPDKTTTYVATVSKAGCVDTLSITLVVEECVEPFVPNAFTPNNDNVNDILYVRVKDYQELRIIIYNRWGQEVFDTRDPEVGWDGTFRGRQLPPDVYGFYVYVRCPDGVEFKKSGSISLIR